MENVTVLFNPYSANNQGKSLAYKLEKNISR